MTMQRTLRFSRPASARTALACTWLALAGVACGDPQRVGSGATFTPAPSDQGAPVSAVGNTTEGTTGGTGGGSTGGTSGGATGGAPTAARGLQVVTRTDHNLCLSMIPTVGSAAPHLTVADCANLATQAWRLVGGRVLLADGKCLDVASGVTTPGNNLVASPCATVPTPTQAWGYRNGALQMEGTTLCAELAGANANPGTPAVLGTCNGGLPQTWDLEASTGAGEAGFAISTAGAATCLTATGTDNGALVSTLPCNGSSGQAWRLVGNTLQALGKCLDLVNNVATPGATLRLWECNNLPQQQWSIDQGLLRQVTGPQCVSVTSAQTAQGSDVQAFPCGTDPRQQWLLGVP
jgi:hypothetical protein